MSRKITLSEGEFYHIYNRGVDKRKVFENDSDYKRFMLLLYLCNDKAPVKFDHLPKWRGSTSPELMEIVFGNQEDRKPLVAVGAFCLMPNHFHILLKEIKTNGISSFMQKLSTAYTMYFNINRERTGALFQGRFKAEHMDNDVYLKYIFSYIHLNPVKLVQPNWKEKGVIDKPKVKKYLRSYPYSSYMDYIGTQREFSKILNSKEFPNYFPSQEEIDKSINDWLDFRGKGKNSV